MVGAKVALKRFELLAILKAHDVVREDGPLRVDCRRLERLGLGFDRAAVRTGDGLVDVANESRQIGRSDEFLLT
jgi:hypothetical protein